jgi:tetratricopeptide (TPR) repeat protein
VALDPLSPIKGAALAWGYYFGRRYPEAIELARRALELDPAMAVTHLWLGMALDQAGATDDAIRSYEEGVRHSRGEPLGLAFLAHGLARAGRIGEARARLAELEEMRNHRYVSAYDLAVIHTGLGDPEAALDLLQHGYEERTHCMALLQVEPRLDPLRSHPRFARLLERMRLSRT